MKIIIVAALLISGSALAQELSATDALLQTLPAGNYSGRTLENRECEVSIRDLTNKVAVVATTKNLTKRSEILKDAVYRWNPGTRSFLASVFSTSLNGSSENVFRTIAVKETTQYVVVADIEINNRTVNESKVECVIDL